MKSLSFLARLPQYSFSENFISPLIKNLNWICSRKNRGALNAECSHVVWGVDRFAMGLEMSFSIWEELGLWQGWKQLNKLHNLCRKFNFKFNQNSFENISCFILKIKKNICNLPSININVYVNYINVVYIYCNIPNPALCCYRRSSLWIQSHVNILLRNHLKNICVCIPSSCSKWNFNWNWLLCFVCSSQLSYCFYEMAPSAAQTEHLPSNAANDPWNQQNSKENQRPPVFFPEDYIAALKKFSKFGSNAGSHKSIYDTLDDAKTEKAAVIATKSRTLPLSKNSEYKWVSYPSSICAIKLSNHYHQQEPYCARGCRNDAEAIRINHRAAHQIEGRFEAIVSKVRIAQRFVPIRDRCAVSVVNDCIGCWSRFRFSLVRCFSIFVSNCASTKLRFWLYRNEALLERILRVSAYFHPKKKQNTTSRHIRKEQHFAASKTPSRQHSISIIE